MNDYTDKTILITGASKGLGRIAAEAFAGRGARLCVAGRTEDQLRALTGTFPDPDSHLIYCGDLMEPENIAQLAQDVIKAWGAPDIIIHCMGGGYGFHDPLLEWEQLEKLYRVNLAGGAELNRLLVPAMVERCEGYVVHVGSTASTEAIGSVGYNTVKAALASYTRSLGNALAESNVIVTGILPGAFYGPENAWRRMEKNKPEVLEKFVSERLPRDRIADGEEILPLLFLLTSEGASMMAGTCVAIDAGESHAYVAR
jgi:NAD(P)-dependent dehydrogenase (short-subunit alcohol dehydrogenase family)